MHDCNVIVAANNVAKRGEALFYALDFDFGWKRVAQVLQFLVCGGCGDEKTVAVTEGEILAFVFFLHVFLPARKGCSGWLNGVWLCPTHPTIRRPTMRVPAMVA